MKVERIAGLTIICPDDIVLDRKRIIEIVRAHKSRARPAAQA